MKNRKEERQSEAANRQNEYDKLSTQEKLEKAIRDGHENTKQVSKLRKRLEKEKKGQNA